MLHFGGGVEEPDGELVLVFGAAAAEPAFELLERWRHEEDVGECVADHRVIASADVCSPCGIDVEEDIRSRDQALGDRGFERAIKVPVHLGVFEEVAGCDVAAERIGSKKKVIGSMRLSGARGAGGAGNGVNKILGFAQLSGERCLADARWGGEDEEDA